MPELKTILEAVLLAAGERYRWNAYRRFSRKQNSPNGRRCVPRWPNDGRLCRTRAGTGGSRQRFPRGGTRRFHPGYRPVVEEQAATYSRALLETLALVAYRQPVTRGEIEEVRRQRKQQHHENLQERDWIKIVSHRGNVRSSGPVMPPPALFGIISTSRAYMNCRRWRPRAI